MFDGDTTMTTNNPYVIKGVERDSLPIVCVQGSASKELPTEKGFIKANKNSFGSDIGSITNRGTSMYDMLANFEKGSKEYNELLYRLICIQDYQQNSIDKSKGCLARPMPKEWYEWKPNKVLEGDSEEIIKEKEFNQRILADKKPYFFIYNYPTLKKEYRDYFKPNDQTCRVKFGIGLQELMFKKYKTEQEIKFLDNFKKEAPVSMANSTMNKIAWIIEEHYMNTKFDFHIEDFDCGKLKSDVEYSMTMYNRVAKLKEEYDLSVKESIKASIKNREHSIDTNELKTVLLDYFKEQAFEICNDEKVLCNIVVDMCYKNSNKSKQFAWSICGEQMIENLLNHHNRKISYPTQDENGDIQYKGLKFKMEEIEV